MFDKEYVLGCEERWGPIRVHLSFLEELGREVLGGGQNLGPMFRRSLIDLIEKEVPSWFGAWGSMSRLEVSELGLFWMWE